MRFLPVPARVDIPGRRVQCTSRPLPAVGRIPQMFGPASAYRLRIPQSAKRIAIADLRISDLGMKSAIHF